MQRTEIPVCAALLFGLSVTLSAASATAPTYAGQVSRIVEKHCTACHRKGGVGPFPLTNYDEVSAFATEIRRATQSRKMPPWFAAPGHGEFQNQRQLTVDEIKTLGDWYDAGAPPGNLKDLSPSPVRDGEWAYGQPDVILTPKKPYTVSRSAGEDVRCFVVPYSFSGPKSIRAMDVRPGDPGAVYHVRAFADTTGSARRLEAQDSQSGFDCSRNMESVLTQKLLGEWEVGNTFSPLPDGFGRSLPKGADIVLEIHYHRTNRPASDQTRVALYFQRQPVQHDVQTVTIVNHDLRIPPGEANYHAAAEWTSKKDILAIGLTPHMHRLGTAVRISASAPGEAVRDLVWVNRYNFRWQTAYVFKEPILIRKGTTVRVDASYDNSNQNMNLDPRQPLHEACWGNGMEDEMLAVFLEYVETKGSGRVRSAQ
jgi:hypothetical protein